MLYAVVDIETTGGRPFNSRITEICVVVTDGKSILQEFETLLNPGCHIPLGITSLTGIDNKMVVNAPVFADIAGKLHHLLHDKIFIAHNVNFDYSFLHAEFEQLGIPFSVQKACSAKAARKAFPGYRSYGLGNICSSLGIEIQNRHRAGGDARATTELIHKIVAKHGEDFLLEMAGRNGKQLILPPGIEESEITKLPNTPGIYYFLNSSGKPLYIGKAINIQKRVLQHFDRKRGKSALQLEKIVHINFEETGSELMALIVEAEEINKHWPEWNKAGKFPANRYAIVQYLTQNGEMRLQTARRAKNSKEGIGFSRLTDARNALGKIISENGICASRAYSNLGCTDTLCYCAENEKMRIKIHNTRVTQAIYTLEKTEEELFILCRGRSEEETGIIYLVNGAVLGRGFANYIPEYPNADSLVDKMKNLAETKAIAGAFLRKIAGGLVHGYRILPIKRLESTVLEQEERLAIAAEPAISHLPQNKQLIPQKNKASKKKSKVITI